MNRLARVVGVMCAMTVLLYGFSAQGAGFFDWRSQPGGDYTTPVRNQAGCGSCWAFAAVAALEAKFEIYNNDPNLNLDLSEQHLIMDPSGGGGCSGGWEYLAMEFYRDHGIVNEAKMPYTASNSSPDWPLTGAYDLYGVNAIDRYLNPGYDGGTQAYSASNIKAALEAEGPLPTFIDAYTDFYNPFTGNRMYGGSGGYHCVAIIGYDEDSYTSDYFLVKNSWGAGWGPTSDGIGYVPYDIIEDWGRTHAITGDPWVQHIPEPSTFVIWSLFGGLGIIVWRRRRRWSTAT